MFCLPNEQRYDCDLNTGQKLCKPGYFGQDCFDGNNNKQKKLPGMKNRRRQTHWPCFFLLILDTRACEDQPCLNNGTCIEYYRGYLCRCQRGYTGQSCEIGKNRKKSNANEKKNLFRSSNSNNEFEM